MELPEGEIDLQSREETQKKREEALKQAQVMLVCNILTFDLNVSQSGYIAICIGTKWACVYTGDGGEAVLAEHPLL